jgi:hypothetical protein
VADNPSPPAPPAPPAPEPTTGQGHTSSVDERLAAQDAKIEGIGSKLELILGKLGGKTGTPPADPAAPPAAPAPADLSIAEQVQRELEASRQREADEARRKGEAAADLDARVNAAIEKLKPEQSPREPQTGLRGRLQRMTIGQP